MRVLFPLALLLGACSVSEAGDAAPAPSSRTEAPTMQMTFDTPSSIQPWRTVNDGVMGGRSSGGPSFAPVDDIGGALVFAGTLNTNGGGFSSIRLPMEPGVLAGADAMRLKLRSDGRDYKLTFRTSQSWRGRNVSWQIPMPATPAGEWAEVIAPFGQAEASVFGRDVDAGTFDPLDVREMGIIIADGVDGDFRLDVASVEAEEPSD